MWAAANAIGLLEVLDANNNVIFYIKLDGGALLGTFDTDNDTATTFVIQACKYYNIVFYCNTLADTVNALYITGGGS